MRSRNVYGRHGREGDSPGVCKSKRRREFVKGKEDEDEDEDEEEDEVWKKIGYFKKKKKGLERGPNVISFLYYRFYFYIKTVIVDYDFIYALKSFYLYTKNRSYQIVIDYYHFLIMLNSIYQN